MMKKRICLILAIASLCSVEKGFAGEKRLSIWAGYSYGKSISPVPDGKTLVYHDGVGAKLIDFGTDREKSGVSFGIDYRLYGNFWVGATVTTGGSYKDYSMLKRQVNIVPDTETSYKSTSFLLNLKWMWLKFESLGFYTRAGLGATTFSDYKFKILDPMGNNPYFGYTLKEARDTSAKFAWQASILGVEWRPVKWGAVFAEGGLGNQGNLLAGLRVYVL